MHKWLLAGEEKGIFFLPEVSCYIFILKMGEDQNMNFHRDRKIKTSKSLAFDA
jgi:hypothetical protein